MARTYIDCIISQEKYDQQRKLLELQLESLVVPEANFKPKPLLNQYSKWRLKEKAQVIKIINGHENESPYPAVFPVEARETLSLPETILCFV